ncbi:hypothetical protein ACFY8W_21775 [Streptomyces sp. NPDC012637]|uniref:hypothetical protein n=1 Tax=Streptomyces sp. NPDC012637 TaxID=3364842 RepID=UPI0036E2A370
MLLSAAISVGPVAFTSPAEAAPLNAGVYLTPDSGPAGTDVTVGGQGFEACGEVTITFDGGHGEPGTVNVPEISGSITVPEGTPAGQHSIEATCDEDPDTGDYYYGSASFTVTGDGGGNTPDEPLALALTPDHGSIGDPIDVRGTGFDVCAAGTVYLHVLDGGPEIASGIPVTETGAFSYTEVIPAGTVAKTYTFRAECTNEASLYADDDLVVEAPADPQLTLAEEEGAKGNTVRAEGTGFRCSNVDLVWDGAEAPLTTAAVTEQATFSTEVPVPGDAQPGPHTVRAVCVDYPEQYADAPFTVTPTGGGTDNGGTDNGGTDNGGTDNGGTDNGGTDNGGTDNGGTDNGGTDNGGTDNGGTDNGGTDNGGTDSGGGSGGSGGGSATPVGLVVGGSSGAALALAAAALVYFGRLHRGPRWVHKHVRAALRPATGATALTETRQPGDPPTHTTRLDPHTDPGRQRLEGDGSEEEER